MWKTTVATNVTHGATRWWLRSWRTISIYPVIHLSIISNCRSVCRIICLSNCRSVYLSIYLSFFLSFFFLFLYLSITLYIYHHFYLSLYISIPKSICRFTYPFFLFYLSKSKYLTISLSTYPRWDELFGCYWISAQIEKISFKLGGHPTLFGKGRALQTTLQF